MPITPGVVLLVVFDTRLSVWAAGTLGLLVRLTDTPLNWKVCSTRCITALLKAEICWAEGCWPPKKLEICELLYQGRAFPVVIWLASGYGPVPRFTYASATG